jgi:hypothetical protein
MNHEHLEEQLEAAVVHSIIGTTIRKLEEQGAVVTEADPTIDERTGAVVLNYVAVMPLSVGQIRLEFRAEAS